MILDAGPLTALLNRRDRWHSWAVETLGGLEPPLWSNEAVLTEAAHLTQQPAAIMAHVRSGVIRVSFRVEDNAAHLARLLARYAPRMDLADACVVRMSELTRDCRILTLDRRDFAIYRRNGREVLPLLTPPD